MALSGVRDTAETAGDMVTAAARKLFVLEGGESLEAEDMAIGLEALWRMLRSWAATGISLWLQEEQTVTLAANTATYTLSPRTLEVTAGYRRSGTTDIPITMMARDVYQRLTNKSANGAPYAFWHDRERAESKVTVYPVPSAAGDTIVLLSKRSPQDVTEVTHTMEIPPEWSEAIVYNLALRLAPEFDAEVRQDVAMMASQLYADMAAQGREHSLKFRPSRRR